MTRPTMKKKESAVLQYLRTVLNNGTRSERLAVVYTVTTVYMSYRNRKRGAR
jgi:hypothetical protein